LTEITTEEMTTPNGWDDKPLQKRAGTRGLLPTSWLKRPVKLSYTDATGMSVDTSALLLDWCALGGVFAIGGARTIIPWERLALIELVQD